MPAGLNSRLDSAEKKPSKFEHRSLETEAHREEKKKKSVTCRRLSRSLARNQNSEEKEIGQKNIQMNYD